MGEIWARNFGLVIAYLVPGFIAVVGGSVLVPVVQAWLAGPPQSEPTIGGFLYLALASLAAGMLISAVRWAALDTLHHTTGVKPPKWDFARLQDNLDAYSLLVEFHYRYYQFYANTLVALAVAYAVRVTSACGWCRGPGWIDVGFVLIEAVLLAASRDTLRKYYARVSHVLSAGPSETKGPDHDERRRTGTRTRRHEGSEGEQGEGGEG